jgi:hypothetical protein
MTPPSINGTNVLLEGPSGTGKTYALAGAAEWAQAHGMKMSVLFLDPGLETLLGAWKDRNSPAQIPECLSWHSSHIKPLGLEDLIQSAHNVGMMDYANLTKLSDPNRSANNPLEKILRVLSNFPDDRTGKPLGPVDSWDASHILAIDSLSELGNAAMKMCVGNRPTASQPDYGVAQNNLMNLLRYLTQGCACHFILIAHVDRQLDQVMGGVKIMTKAPGQAISGDIPPLFSDVILTVREADRFYWDTASTLADLKTRNLPIAGKQPPNFATIFDKWLRRFT